MFHMLYMRPRNRQGSPSNGVKGAAHTQISVGSFLEDTEKRARLSHLTGSPTSNRNLWFQ